MPSPLSLPRLRFQPHGPLAVLLGSATALLVLAAGWLTWLTVAPDTVVDPGIVAGLGVGLIVGSIQARARLARYRARSVQRERARAQVLTIQAMTSVAGTRDPETGEHTMRTQHYVKAIALALRQAGHYRQTLTPDYIDLLFLSAPLHDIGKIAVPDHILLKEGKLTPDETVQMRRHAEIGRQIILSAARHIDGDNFLLLASQVAGCHHEKWDGTGYPQGLAGQEIPLAGRIMAVADVYDALTSRRSYKKAFTHEDAMKIMRDLRGKAFDPTILDAFVSIERQVLEIARRFREPHEEPSNDTKPVVVPEQAARSADQPAKKAGATASLA